MQNMEIAFSLTVRHSLTSYCLISSKLLTEEMIWENKYLFTFYRTFLKIYKVVGDPF